MLTSNVGNAEVRQKMRVATALKNWRPFRESVTERLARLTAAWEHERPSAARRQWSGGLTRSARPCCDLPNDGYGHGRHQTVRLLKPWSHFRAGETVTLSASLGEGVIALGMARPA